MVETADARISLHIEGAVAFITLNRPEKLNALDKPMILALERAALAVDQDAAIRVAILTGAGEKAFCAGGDIAAWSAEAPEDFGLQWVRVGHRAFDALARLRVPLIAALNGAAMGGGLELAACADFRIAEDHVKFSLPETGLGIIPGWSGTQRAVARFGAQTVRRLSLAGESVLAAEAERLGLCDKVVPKGQGLAAARAMATSIAARSALATAAAKLMINAADGEDAPRALEALGGIAAAHSAELRAGLAAFAAKKKN
ncbi:MAG: enoyl-CoA hydratase/isomerase family protein [Alphaproteobacteria bacterium]|nr:enoyl-CoA hydratase/isomerase family protein [Alphaproteobacteria bacterium]